MQPGAPGFDDIPGDLAREGRRVQLVHQVEKGRRAVQRGRNREGDGGHGLVPAHDVGRARPGRDDLAVERRDERQMREAILRVEVEGLAGRKVRPLGGVAEVVVRAEVHRETVGLFPPELDLPAAGGSGER